MENEPARPFEVYILVILLIFQSSSGLFGGLGLILSPSGEFLQLPLSLLQNTPFHNYLIPGIILALFLGLFPLMLPLPLLLKPLWRWANKLNIYKDMYWAWTFSLYTGIMVVIWITVQVYLTGGSYILQFVYSLVGVAIIISSLLPRVIQHYLLK